MSGYNLYDSAEILDINNYDGDNDDCDYDEIIR